MEGLVEMMRQKPERFYKGKRVLVTGHTGFKGGWLSLWLLKFGAQVTGYALKPAPGPNFFNILNLRNHMHSVTGDIRDKKKLQLFFKDFKPEIVIHMAAQSLVRQSYQDPIMTYETNVMGTVNVLNICREFSGVRAIVNVTSDKCYENQGKNKSYKETDSMGGFDPYSSSKGCAELVTTAYQKSFFAKEKYNKDHRAAIASARAGNVIGGGDWNKDRLIPDCIRVIFGKENLVIRYPNAIRPWQYVLEPLYGYLLLAMRLYEDGPTFSGPWNFGPGKKNEKTVKWILEKFKESWDGFSWEIEVQPQPHESASLRLNSYKAESLLGWHPKLGLVKALKETVQWYQAWHDKVDMNALSLNQIKNYMQDI